MRVIDFQGDSEPIDGYLALNELNARDFTVLFNRLVLPRDQWAKRLGLKRNAFDRWRHELLKARYTLPVFIDPVTKRAFHRGVDIRRALDVSMENGSCI